MVSEIRLPKLVTGAVPNESSEPLIVTHNGRFHCDDVLSVGLLLTLDDYKDAVVIRTRDPQIWEKGDVVVDVGGVYDPERRRFDHHQRGFSEFYDAGWRTVTKLSSVGMVFRHFGRRILIEKYKVPEAAVDVIQKKLYENLIESIDAIDNGVNITPPGTDALFIIRTDLSSRVARQNAEWNEWKDDMVNAEDFSNAIQIAMEEFNQHVKYLRDSWLPARSMVEKALEKRFDVDPSGKVIVLEDGCPYETHLFDLEEELGLCNDKAETSAEKTEEITTSLPKRLRSETTAGRPLPSGILFAIYPSDKAKTQWRVKAIKKGINTFQNRLSFPEPLCGLREDALADKKLPGIHFIHNAGFLAGANSLEAAMDLVRYTFNWSCKSEKNST